MPLSPEDVEFLLIEHSAAMITLGADGKPKVARCGVALVDGQLWSSREQDRVRTQRLRRDPAMHALRARDLTSLAWTRDDRHLLDGPDAPELNLRLFRVM
jgi:hypothetical protein